MKELMLVTGRTVSQAAGMHKGKDSREYLDAVTLARMNRADMDEMGVSEGDVIRLKNGDRFVEVPVFEDNLPEGMVFMPMGPVANTLILSDTKGTGMPAFKDQMVEVTKP